LADDVATLYRDAAARGYAREVTSSRNFCAMNFRI
jgi:hypothetical protein